MTTRDHIAATQEETSTPTKGSCLCGAVKFSISGLPSLQILCHCISCKKISGSLFQANNIYNTTQLTISPNNATKFIKTYIDKSPDSQSSVIHRSFCAECGSRLWNAAPDEAPGIIVVMVGSLDLSDEEWKTWIPQREFFCKRKGGWLRGVGAPEEGRTLEM
ncbi:related to DUF636 domain protein [Rhynchosporium secalis]|uniref:Related to DUF636 domain protein n=1 Tax=Rhynchosporium secalis TaxID=38038 RepID=A0A1E1LVI7_RHYSE|nr:related to DUF636 domain protein [Rhynchosporium secalis]